MNYQELIQRLRAAIDNQLEPIIGNKCIIADAPYYRNIGDVMIWQGIEDFLKSINRKLLCANSLSTFQFPEIENDVTILLMGGGNFGDLWRDLQEFRIKVIKHYFNNRIVMFPQSVWYDDYNLIEMDAKIFASHGNLYLCARDRWSYEFMINHFSANNILLIPDMAFCIEESRLQHFRSKSTSTKLYFKRLDKEAAVATPLNIGKDYDVHDWPTIENNSKTFYSIYKTWGLARRLESFPWITKMLYSLSDIYASKIVKNKLVKQGCNFLAPYGSVVTTRLHAMILSILLHKPVEYIDNSTGKLSAFADTWLKECENIKPYNPKNVK